MLGGREHIRGVRSRLLCVHDNYQIRHFISFFPVGAAFFVRSALINEPQDPSHEIRDLLMKFLGQSMERVEIETNDSAVSTGLCAQSFHFLFVCAPTKRSREKKYFVFLK